MDTTWIKCQSWTFLYTLWWAIRKCWLPLRIWDHWNFLFPNHLLAQNTNVGSDPNGDFEDYIIEGFLESIKKESIPFELNNIPQQI